jgi:hypothetical protein
MGKREMESMIHEEIRDMMEEVRRYVGDNWSKTVPVRELVAATGANVICHMLLGMRFSLRDPELRKLMNVIRNFTSLVNASGGLAGSMPILLRVFPSITEYPQIVLYKNQLYAFLTVRSVILPFIRHISLNRDIMLEKCDTNISIITTIRTGETHLHVWH